MEFEGKVVVVTGGVQGIGKAIVEAFEQEGATVCIIDREENLYFTGDIGDRETLEAFVKKVLDEHGKVDYLVNNAMISMGGINACGYGAFDYALRVGVVAPYYLTKLFNSYFAPGAAIVNISSSRDRMSQPNTESYTAAKGAISSLTHALAISLGGRVRVNSVSPGWIETGKIVYDGADAGQHPVKRVGTPMDIANMVLFLCSEKAGFITGENICIDGGMTRQMIYHDDNGWGLEE
ncbi:SDR family oxidoreductase [Anaerotignum sp. MB30-C6]|uniref:SDR family oxidoreductase n=1 Tax=Anaerotignum sp. MB30-C6 TaxID=3070814 RepID=UPI0027DBEFE0|nr:SDR family oxidoreductase [Anaerotignum sp. MB30-C6]WMI81113.1 SDR family oxidoreductase [Anaerotignum sp. MB30-C6]